MTAASHPLRTYEDLLAIPDDGKRRELIDGEIIVVPSPGWDHFAIERNLFLVFFAAARAANAGEVIFAPFTVRLSDHSAPEPDLLFIRAGRLPRLLTPTGIEGAPDLTLEIVSPSSRQIDRVKKFNLYAAHGVAEYWLVDPANRAIEVFSLVNGQYEPLAADADGAHASRVIPGLRVRPEEIFTGLFADQAR